MSNETPAVKVAALLQKLQDRISKVGLQSGQTAAALCTLNDETRLKTANLSLETSDLRRDVRELNDELDATDANANNMAEALEELEMHVSTFDSRLVALDKSIAVNQDRWAAVEKVNDTRESQQTLRDQSNVQSIKDLRDSVDVAFKIVEKDVAALDAVDKSQSAWINQCATRITEVEKFQADLVERAKKFVSAPFETRVSGGTQLPVGHVWVNKKLTGVYDSITELENRLKKLETPAPPSAIEDPYEDFAKYDYCYPAPSEKPTEFVNYCGFNVRFQGNRLLLQNADGFDIFYVGEPWSHEIIGLTEKPYGIQIHMKGGDQYCLTGGPILSLMYLMCLVKGA